MNKRMWHDPNESPLVRDLLRVGREAKAIDYDLEAGLAKHLTQIKAGVPAPSWAESIAPSAGAAVPTSAVSWLVTVGALVGAAAIYATVSQEPPVSPPARPSPPAPQVEPQAVPEVRGDEAATPAVRDPQTDAKARPQVANTKKRPRRVPSEEDHAALRGAQRRRRDAEGRGRSSGARRAGLAQRPNPDRASTSKPRSVFPVKRGRSRSTPPTLEDVFIPVLAPAAAADDGAEEPVQSVPLRPAPEPQAEDDGRLELEMRMLKVAQDSLDKDPARSLRLVKLGEREFPGGLFTQERHYVWIAALARLGHLDEASRRARIYLKAYPEGPYSQRVRRALEHRMP